MIRNLSGGGVLYGDSVRCFVMREQFVGRDRRESLVTVGASYFSILDRLLAGPSHCSSLSCELIVRPVGKKFKICLYAPLGSAIFSEF